MISGLREIFLRDAHQLSGFFRKRDASSRDRGSNVGDLVAACCTDAVRGSFMRTSFARFRRVI